MLLYLIYLVMGLGVFGALLALAAAVDHA